MRSSEVRPPRELVQVARRLARTDDHTSFWFIAGDWATIVAAVVLAQLVHHPAAVAVAVVVIGTRMRALANLVHEASHYKLFRLRALNAAVGSVLCAWPVAESLGVYTREHHRHHRTLWISDDDPDRRLYEMTGTETETRSRMSYSHFLVQHVLLVVLPWQPARRLLHDRRQLARAGCLVVATTVVLAAAPPVGQLVALYWLLPWLTTYQMVSYWAEIAEHGGLWEKGWDWGSRNWRGHLVTRWLIAPHSTDLYHLAHHWFPAVPHWRLARLDEACRHLWPEYRHEQRCDGFFLSGTGDRSSVMRDMWTGGAPLDAERGLPHPGGRPRITASSSGTALRSAQP